MLTYTDEIERAQDSTMVRTPQGRTYVLGGANRDCVHRGLYDLIIDSVKIEEISNRWTLAYCDRCEVAWSLSEGLRCWNCGNAGNGPRNVSI